jgi:hypothetical protein
MTNPRQPWPPPDRHDAPPVWAYPVFGAVFAGIYLIGAVSEGWRHIIGHSVVGSFPTLGMVVGRFVSARHREPPRSRYGFLAFGLSVFAALVGGVYVARDAGPAVLCAYGLALGLYVTGVPLLVRRRRTARPAPDRSLEGPA